VAISSQEGLSESWMWNRQYAEKMKTIGGAEGDRTPDLRIANAKNRTLHSLTCSDINLQFFNRLQPVQEQFLAQFLSSIFIDLH